MRGKRVKQLRRALGLDINEERSKVQYQDQNGTWVVPANTKLGTYKILKKYNVRISTST